MRAGVAGYERPGHGRLGQKGRRPGSERSLKRWFIREGGLRRGIGLSPWIILWRGGRHSPAASLPGDRRGTEAPQLGGGRCYRPVDVRVGQGRKGLGIQPRAVEGVVPEPMKIGSAAVVVVVVPIVKSLAVRVPPREMTQSPEQGFDCPPVAGRLSLEQPADRLSADRSCLQRTGDRVDQLVEWWSVGIPKMNEQLCHEVPLCSWREFLLCGHL